MIDKKYINKEKVNIKYFCDLSKEQLAEIIDIHFDYWKKFNPALDRVKVEKEFKEEYSVCKDKIPLGVALFMDGRLVAFCRLRVTNLKCCLELSPWISGLFVLPEFRGLGLGKMIVDEMCDIAKRLGIKIMYVWTDQTPDFYVKLGFEFLRTVFKNEGGEAMLFCKQL